MVKRNGDYREIIVHSVRGRDSQGRMKVQVRPIDGQIFGPDLNVACSKKLIDNYPVGTKFRIKVQLTDMQGALFLYSYFGWPYDVISK